MQFHSNLGLILVIGRGETEEGYLRDIERRERVEVILNCSWGIAVPSDVVHSQPWSVLGVKTEALIGVMVANGFKPVWLWALQPKIQRARN